MSKRMTESQIVAILKEADAGVPVKELCRQHGIASSTFYKWKGGDVTTLPQDVLERISYIFGIYSALQVLLPKPEAADGWIKKPNTAPLFGGKSALDRMLSGQVADLYVVRQYLDAQRGG